MHGSQRPTIRVYNCRHNTTTDAMAIKVVDWRWFAVVDKAKVHHIFSFSGYFEPMARAFRNYFNLFIAADSQSFSSWVDCLLAHKKNVRFVSRKKILNLLTTRFSLLKYINTILFRLGLFVQYILLCGRKKKDFNFLHTSHTREIYCSLWKSVKKEKEMRGKNLNSSTPILQICTIPSNSSTRRRLLSSSVGKIRKLCWLARDDNAHAAMLVEARRRETMTKTTARWISFQSLHRKAKASAGELALKMKSKRPSIDEWYIRVHINSSRCID